MPSAKNVHGKQVTMQMPLDPETLASLLLERLQAQLSVALVKCLQDLPDSCSIESFITTAWIEMQSGSLTLQLVIHLTSPDKGQSFHLKKSWPLANLVSKLNSKDETSSSS